MTNEEREEITGLGPAFAALLQNEAFAYMARRFDSQCLQVSTGDLQHKAERYIAESAIKSFLRDINSFAHGGSVNIDVNGSVDLEDEGSL